MTPATSRALLALSLLLLVAVALAWISWPDDDPRADLRAVRSIAATSTSTTTSTTTSTPAASSTSSTTTTTAPPLQPLVLPVRVQIPSIGLDAPVVAVALQPDGQMELPPAADVGWYELGPSPGQPGSAVLAAHVDYAGQRGAFFDLRSVAPGAEVLVEGDGTSRRFIVSSREQVAKDAVRLERYFTAQGPARITLITCGGVFDRGVGHYRDNVILTADLVP